MRTATVLALIGQLVGLLLEALLNLDVLVHPDRTLWISGQTRNLAWIVSSAIQNITLIVFLAFLYRMQSRLSR